MPRVLIGLIYRIVGISCNRVRLMLQRTPEVSHHAIEVVY
jgi:hypothetical protein